MDAKARSKIGATQAHKKNHYAKTDIEIWRSKYEISKSKSGFLASLICNGGLRLREKMRNEIFENFSCYSYTGHFQKKILKKISRYVGPSPLRVPKNLLNLFINTTNYSQEN